MTRILYLAEQVLQEVGERVYVGTPILILGLVVMAL
tara:strand:+ start:6395 stop:6502 length:108 start_codon:yes stop_codon:yes gene_type:complete